MNFIQRPRRMRRTPAMRAMVQESALTVQDFIAPLFVCPGEGIRREISSMPGQFHFSIDQLLREVQTLVGLGIPAILLFGLPQQKDELGSESYANTGTVQSAVRAIKREFPGLTVITDVCLCSYTSHGHCGVLTEHAGHVDVDNDSTLNELQKIAVSHAEAGADWVAPSGMMDGAVEAIRTALDHAGFPDTAILAYTTKYASSFYSSFRQAADCAPQQGDRKTYQMNPANAREALVEAALDVAQGADLLMVKPALSYLDIVKTLRDNFNLPLVAYNVSAEYSMIKAAAAQGFIDENGIMLESLLSMKRAGADLIITYFAKQAAEILTAR